MLKWINGIAFAWKPEARRRRRRVDRRLRAEVHAAWLDPSPQLRRHTIAALNDAYHGCHACHASHAEGGRGMSSRTAYAVACLSLIVLGAIAVRLGDPGAAGLEPAANPPAVLARLDTTFDTLIRTPLQELEVTLESTLRTEAELIAADARNAGEFLLAALPLPATWTPLTRLGG